MRETSTNHTPSPKYTPLPTALVTEAEVAQFKELAYREYGVTLTDQQAYEQAIALLTLFDSLLEKRLAFGYQNDMITDE